LNIYVGNLPKSVTEETLRSLFEQHGEVTEIKLIKDHFTGELRGFGFVEMPAKSDALNAIQQIDGTEFEGNTLIVNQARPRKERPGGGQMGGGKGFRGPRSRS